MQLVQVDHAVCLRDGNCMRSCGRKLLIEDEQGFPFLPEDKEARCTRCGHCAAVCPVDAFRLRVVDGEDVTRIREDLNVSFEQAAQLMQSCRSIRKFEKRAVPQGDIAEILQVARLAPTGGNNQLVRWIVLEDAETVKTVADMIAEWFDTMARHNPRHSARYAIDNILARYRAGEDTILRGAHNAVLTYSVDTAAWGPIDSAIALTYFNLAAHSRGLGCCWGGYLMRASVEYPPLREFLGVEEGSSVQGAMVFGYPDMRYHAIPVRKTVDVRWIGQS